MDLHEGEAHDVLEAVCQAVKFATGLHHDKQKHATGQMMNLKAGDMVCEGGKKQNKAVEKYKKARAAMIGLGRDVGESFPEMKPEDLWMKLVSENCKVGDGTKVEGWIWQVGALGDMNDEERDAFMEEGQFIMLGCKYRYLSRTA